MGLSASKLSTNSASKRNETAPSGQNAHKNGGSTNAGALIDVLAQSIAIFVAVILIVVAAQNKTKFRRLLLIWFAWVILEIVLVSVGMIVGVVEHKSNFIDIFISLVVCVYIMASFWFVYSYYKLLAIDPAAATYNGSSKEKEFSAIG